MHHVFYRGEKTCEVLFIGEAPGNSEDVLGLPFIGPAGKLLDSILKDAVHPKRFIWGVTNIVCCAPWDNETDKFSRKTRPPSKEEAKACKPRLQELIELVQPKAVVLVGASASKYLAWCKLPRLSIIHPAAMLRKTDYSIDRLKAIALIRAFVKDAL